MFVLRDCEAFRFRVNRIWFFYKTSHGFPFSVYSYAESMPDSIILKYPSRTFWFWWLETIGCKLRKHREKSVEISTANYNIDLHELETASGGLGRSIKMKITHRHVTISMYKPWISAKWWKIKIFTEKYKKLDMRLSNLYQPSTNIKLSTAAVPSKWQS